MGGHSDGTVRVACSQSLQNIPRLNYEKQSGCAFSGSDREASVLSVQYQVVHWRLFVPHLGLLHIRRTAVPNVPSVQWEKMYKRVSTVQATRPQYSLGLQYSAEGLYSAEL